MNLPYAAVKTAVVTLGKHDAAERLLPAGFAWVPSTVASLGTGNHALTAHNIALHTAIARGAWREHDAMHFAALTPAVLTGPALPPDWTPFKPLRCIVGFPPGGATDLVARMLQPKLSACLATRVVVPRAGVE